MVTGDVSLTQWVREAWDGRHVCRCGLTVALIF